MSLSLATVNSPALVASAGAAALALLPALEEASVSSRLPFSALQALNGLLYGVNFWATTRPGRLDGRDDLARKGRDLLEAISLTNLEGRDRSLLVPEGWAFSLWAPIFLGELMFVAAAAFVPATAPVAAVIKRAMAGFMMAQVFQSLWTAAYRPKYQKNSSVFISTAMLSGIAWSLSRAHEAYTAPHLIPMYGNWEYFLYFLPMSLHFGWTTAAALVDLNGSIADIADDKNKKLLAVSGHLSAIAATAAGVGITVTRRAPVFGGVVAWALTACAGTMRQRVEESTAEERQTYPGLYGVVTQQWLCGLGAALSAAASIWTAVSMKQDEHPVLSAAAETIRSAVTPKPPVFKSI